MSRTVIPNVVIFNPIGPDDCCPSFNYKGFTAEHLDGDWFLRFDINDNGITSFDTLEQPYLSVERELNTRRGTLSLGNNMPTLVIRGTIAANPVNESYWLKEANTEAPGSSINVDGVKLRFEPSLFRNVSRSNGLKFTITDKTGKQLGNLLLPGFSRVTGTRSKPIRETVEILF